MKNIFFYQTDFGIIGIAGNENAVTNLYFQGENTPEDAIVSETEILEEAGGQLRAYLTGQLKDFTLPLAPSGTEFMQRVWQSLRTIPYGETRSYQEIAQSVGNKKASRAVGLANNRNPIPIFIPCHRVIGANGKLIGYGGGLELKARLLELEKKVMSAANYPGS
jgi:methylated-DNA-[protein]-cysteine S-methyltransferase